MTGTTGAATLLLSTILATTAAAQEPILLEGIVISANRAPSEASRTGPIVDILDGAALRASTEPTLADAADILPGVSVSSNGGPGAATTLRVRGLQSRYAPAYLNGIKLSDPSATQQDLNYGALTTLGLARVEVLKGAASAVYGSEAVAGAVNLVSAVPDEVGTRLRFFAEYGSFDTARASFGVSTRSERAWLGFDAGRVTTQGISSADEDAGNDERDSFAASSVIATGGIEILDGATLGFSTFLIDSRTDQDGFDFFAGGPADSRGREEARRTGLRVFVTGEALGWSHEVAASAARTERFYPVGFTQRFDGKRHDLTWQASREIGATSLTLGAEAARASFRADAVSGDHDIASAFGEAVVPLGPRADLTLSLRRDDHSEFGGEVTGRAALAVRPDPDTVLRASAGTGYRAPSLYELFEPSFGNPDLRPETSRSLDLGIEREIGPLTLSATAFWIEIEDLIGFGATYEQVAGTTVSRGVELAAGWELREGVHAFANYTLTDTEDAAGNPLVRVPRHDLTLGLRGQVADRVTGALTVRHVAEFTDTDGGFPATAVPLDDYTVADVAAAYEVAPGVELYGRIENLTDADYQTTRGYGTPGRAIYAGLRASF